MSYENERPYPGDNYTEARRANAPVRMAGFLRGSYQLARNEGFRVVLRELEMYKANAR